MSPHWLISHWQQLLVWGFIAIVVVIAFGNFKQ